MGPRGVGNPPHSSLPSPRPPDPSQFKLKLQAHKEEISTRFSELHQSMTILAAEQEEFRRELREELRQLRLSYSEPSLPQPHSNPPMMTVSTLSSSSSAGNPSSPSYYQSQLLKCQLPQSPPPLNRKPQPQIPNPSSPAIFTLPQVVANPTHTQIVIAATPPQFIPQIHHSPNVKPHKMKLKFERGYRKVRIQPLVILKRKLWLKFSHQKQSQTSGDLKTTWVDHRVRYRVCKSQKQFFGRYYHHVYGLDKVVSEICISRKCGSMSGIILCFALVYVWSRSGRKLNLKHNCANYDYNEAFETMLRGKFDKAFIENGESMSLGLVQFDRKGSDFLLGLLMIEFKKVNYNFVRLQLHGLLNEGLHKSMLVPTSDMNSLDLFIKLLVKVLTSGTSVGEICDTKLNVEFFGNIIESDGQCFGEPFSCLQFCESPVNLNFLKAQFRSSNRGDFTYDMGLENWTERTVGNSSKLSGSGKSEVLILDQETNFQQRVSYLEKAIGLLKNNFGLSFASISLYYGDYEHKQLTFGLVLGLVVYTSRMEPEHEHIIGSNINQFYNPNCDAKWVRVVHICNQPSNSSIAVIGFLVTVLELSHGRYDNITWFLLLNSCSVLFAIDSNIFVIAITKNRKNKKVLTLSHFVVMSDRRFKAAILVFLKLGEYFVAIVLLNKMESEYFVATVHLNEMEKEDHLIAAVAFLVKDNNGCINKFGQLEKHYGDMCFSTLLQVHIILIPFLIGTAWPFNALGFAFHLRTCKSVGQAMHVDYALAILTKEGLNSTLKFNIYTITLPKELYIGSGLGAMEVIGVRNALLWDKVLIGETLINSLSVQNFSSEAFEVNCEMTNYSLQLGINPCAMTNNCSFKESEMENLYELIIDDSYNLIGQHCSMFLWRIYASVKPDLKLLLRVEKNLKTTGNLLFNALYEVLCVSLVTASSFNKVRKIIMVISNAVHEPYKTPYIQVLIEVCKTLQLVEDEITKLDGLFNNGPMYFPHIKSAPIPLRNDLKLSLEHNKQVKVFSLQVLHKKSIRQQRCSYLIEQWIEQSCVEYQVGQTVIKFSLPFLSKTHELKLTLVKLKLMELISVLEIASEKEEHGAQYAEPYSDQSMKLGSQFEKWHQSDATALFDSQ